MADQIFAIIMAAGSGTRMGAGTPKQFLPLGGVPILQRTIERFREALPQARIVTVLPREHFQTWKDLCTLHHLDCPQQLVAGGITRFHSVRNALEAVPDGAIVFIHDGVRPLASVSFLRRLADQARSQRALVPVVPLTDTIVTDSGEGVDRSRLRAVQTPQVFRSEDIRAAYRLAYETSFTDDASVARRKGIPLSYVEGERYNLKITTPEDLRLAEALCSLAQ
ncbi:MAG: 2-C-methyl-D-erythritol 4-phosphate cytidylyltransferase [Bacteroidales bacterium]|nr:2-C-methyl-D-erythritol 4-phosphate cytidylyltransferase [Bacteroidales bacterium]MCR5277274.1 2-C-methyl-D-erythritol 4-phosphate cytidylyltransferase [Bacteroidales bacterium]